LGLGRGNPDPAAGAALQDGHPPGRRLPQETQVLPELDSLNYVTRVTLPILMINGNSDFIFPLELGQKPYFARLGTPPEHKRHVVLTGGHYIIGQQHSQVVREVLDWLDRCLGRVDE
jgi:pimeloyl-ACP methyl ester carboxylesterase